jgi:hypothetical protein
MNWRMNSPTRRSMSFCNRGFSLQRRQGAKIKNLPGEVTEVQQQKMYCFYSRHALCSLRLCGRVFN